MRKYPTNTLSRYVGIADLCSYTGLGRTLAARLGKESGAERRVGRRCLYDLRIIDEAMKAGAGKNA